MVVFLLQAYLRSPIELYDDRSALAHGRVVTSSRQITEVKQRRARLVLGWVTARCSSHAPRPCVEVLGKPLISRCLCPPSSDGYLVERES